MLTNPVKDSETSFKQQFFGWLEVSGFPFTELDSGSDMVTHLEIWRGDRQPIHVMLIHICFWIEQGSYKAWERQLAAQKQLRASGRHVVIIWEDYWIKRPAIVRSRISAMLGMSQKIAGRLTQVRRIDQATAIDFLQNNHLNGSVSAKTRYGLCLPKRYYRVLDDGFDFDKSADELLVAVATFSAPRIFQRGNVSYRSFEMIRFASLLGTNVNGGLDKLLTAFIREKSPGDVMTYADLEWSEGAGYAKLGFQRIAEINPIAFTLNLNSLERTSTTLHVDLKPDLLPDQTIIFNAGSAKFVKSFLTDLHG